MNLQSCVGEIITPCYRHQGQRLGKTVVNSQLSHAGIANDVLRQVPMVTGIDGNYFMAIATMSTQGQNTLRNEQKSARFHIATYVI